MSPAPRPLDDATVERLLRRARVDSGADVPEDLEPVARFLSAVADLGDIPVQPTGSLADLLAGGFEPAPAAVPVPARTGIGRFRGRVARVAGLSLVAQVVMGTGVAVASVTAAAGAGVLPSSLQQPVSEVLNVVTPFTFPTAPTTTTQEEPTGTVAPAETADAPAPSTADTSTATTSTTEPAPAPQPTTASTAPSSVEPTASASPSATSSATPSSNGTPTTSPSPAVTAVPTPTGTPTVEPTTSPTPTSEPSPTASSRPTRQNEKKDEDDAVVEPTTDPAVVAVDPAATAG